MTIISPTLDQLNAEMQEAYHQATAAPIAETCAPAFFNNTAPTEISDGKIDVSDLQRAASDLISRINSLPESAKAALQGVDINSLSNASISARDYEAVRSQIQSVVSASETAVGNAESIAREEEGKKIQQAMGEMIGGIATATAAFDSVGAIAGAIGGGAALTGAAMGLTEPSAHSPSVSTPHADPDPQLLNPAARAMGINTDTHGATLETLTMKGIDTDPVQMQQAKLAKNEQDLAKLQGAGTLSALSGTLGNGTMNLLAMNADGTVDKFLVSHVNNSNLGNLRSPFGGRDAEALMYAPTPASGIGIS